MKETEQTNSHNHQHQPSQNTPHKFLNAAAVFIVLPVLAYAVGYLSSPYSHPPSPPMPVNLSQQPTTATATATANDAETTREASSIFQQNTFGAMTQCGDPVPPQLVRQKLIDGLFKSINPYDNFPPPHVRDLIKEQRISGWGSYGSVFESVIRLTQPKVIIEVGTFIGASAIHMAELLRRLGLHDTQILCIDDYRGIPGSDVGIEDANVVNGDALLLYQFIQNVIYKNATETIVPIPFSSASAMERLCEWGIFGDLIEIDASHDFVSAWADLHWAYRILKPGGVMFGHDYFYEEDNYGVRRAVNLFAQMNGFRVRVDGEHWVINTSLSNKI